MIKLLNKVYIFFIIDTIFTLLLLMVNISDFSFMIWPLMIGFIIYLFTLDTYDLITNQIILLIDFNVIYDILWRKSSVNIPINCKILIDIISIIIIFKILINYNLLKKTLRDPIIWLMIVFIIFSVGVAVVNKIPFIEYLMSLRIYIRFLPVYIVLSNFKLEYNRNYLYIFIAINLFLIPIQSLISSYDDVSGVFGIRNVHILLLFLIIMTAIITTIYCKKVIKVYLYLLGIIIIFLICGFGEIKIGMVIIPIEILLIILLNTINPIKLFTSIIVCIFMVNLGLKVLVKISPQFENFFDKDIIKQNIIDYTMKPNNPDYSLGRLENIVYSYNNILTTPSSRITGLGVGSAMPPETYYYQLEKHSRGRDVISLYMTKLYTYYGPYFGYHFSSMNIIFLETGYIGIIIYLSILMIFIKRSILLIIKSGRVIDKAIGNASVALITSLIGLMFYYNYILDRGAIILVVITLAITTNISKNINNNRR